MEVEVTRRKFLAGVFGVGAGFSAYAATKALWDASVFQATENARKLALSTGGPSTGGGGSTTAHAFLGPLHSDTLPASPVRGSIVVGDSTPNWARLALGASGTYPRSNGTDLLYSALLEADLPAALKHALLDANYNNDTQAGTPSLGDLITGQGSPVKWTRQVSTANRWLTSDASGLPSWVQLPFTKGATVLSPGVQNIIIWQARFACTVTEVRGYRVGGTGATVNARRNGSNVHLASDLSLTAADAWMDGGSVQNIAYVAGDKLEILLVTVSGAPSQVAVEVTFTRP